MSYPTTRKLTNPHQKARLPHASAPCMTTYATGTITTCAATMHDYCHAVPVWIVQASKFHAAKYRRVGEVGTRHRRPEDRCLRLCANTVNREAGTAGRMVHTAPYLTASNSQCRASTLTSTPCRPAHPQNTTTGLASASAGRRRRVTGVAPLRPIRLAKPRTDSTNVINAERNQLATALVAIENTSFLVQKVATRGGDHRAETTSARWVVVHRRRAWADGRNAADRHAF